MTPLPARAYLRERRVHVGKKAGLASPQQTMGIGSSAGSVALNKVAARLGIDRQVREWPRQPNRLSRELNEIAPNLRRAGIRIRHRWREKSTVIIVGNEGPPSGGGRNASTKTDDAVDTGDTRNASGPALHGPSEGYSDLSAFTEVKAPQVEPEEPEEHEKPNADKPTGLKQDAGYTNFRIHTPKGDGTIVKRRKIRVTVEGKEKSARILFIRLDSKEEIVVLNQNYQKRKVQTGEEYFFTGPEIEFTLVPLGQPLPARREQP